MNCQINSRRDDCKTWYFFKEVYEDTPKRVTEDIFKVISKAITKELYKVYGE